MLNALPKIPVGADGRVLMVLPQRYPAGCIPVGRGETPEKQSYIPERIFTCEEITDALLESRVY